MTYLLRQMTSDEGDDVALVALLASIDLFFPPKAAELGRGRTSKGPGPAEEGVSWRGRWPIVDACFDFFLAISLYWRTYDHGWAAGTSRAASWCRTRPGAFLPLGGRGRREERRGCGRQARALGAEEIGMRMNEEDGRVGDGIRPGLYRRQRRGWHDTKRAEEVESARECERESKCEREKRKREREEERKRQTRRAKVGGRERDPRRWWLEAVKSWAVGAVGEKHRGPGFGI